MGSFAVNERNMRREKKNPVVPVSTISVLKKLRTGPKLLNWLKDGLTYKPTGVSAGNSCLADNRLSD